MICFVDYRISIIEEKSLKNLGVKIIKVPPCNNLYNAIKGHVDIQLNILSKIDKKVIVQKDISDSFKKELIKNNINFIESKNSLGEKYPSNIALNSLILDNYFIHNLNFSDENLLESQKNKTLVNVKQGYTKCSSLVVNDNSIITSDKGIYNSLLKHNFDILLLPPGDIVLDGLDYGFIGGTGGLINPSTMVFFGSLEKYAYGEEVKKFLKKHNVTPIYLSNSKLYDRGSLFTL
ncbi:DUF6873 family GME fold protein [Clostridium sp.]|uniref:DUF6873 family GME fold protein n=1 Tax=Clostridium sp. TaxID=1506 RepID=UPI001D932FA2|nr:hypothetical protein [Clostridium sp.]MBS5938345.1 hypothetical protein [Clostridium sp.]